ncbi:MAG: hypothetical protein CVV64_05725 [Candidatus Wallbacteria bacterium HGW-Wallbacteria-1]|jgi:methyl-accepting chemotaxis protein|uniref:Methyl-accepting transducer domain-containing protein n=1 Tax=Candidatus Wallbacteria bacterium HGW-Wallbacteria-1 TaxID=2013854 RepID=A0A2N1PSE6_9BACT|nr:MAG: hypothetical protein CVV64_05725 [Candidatus Wallbacteria bacterium HGW-Wallbacteria-1]
MKIAIVGAGQACQTLLPVLCSIDSISVTGVSDINENAPGILLAKELGISIFTHMKDLMATGPDLIIELTGNRKVAEILAEMKSENQQVLTSGSALLMCKVISGNQLTSSRMVTSATDAIEQLVQNLDSMLKTFRNSFSTIEKILIQSKMISMNASIEAARAGSSGNAFAVVVSRIEDLSNQINQALTPLSKGADSCSEMVEKVRILDLELKKSLTLDKG